MPSLAVVISGEKFLMLNATDNSAFFTDEAKQETKSSITDSQELPPA